MLGFGSSKGAIEEREGLGGDDGGLAAGAGAAEIGRVEGFGHGEDDAAALDLVDTSAALLVFGRWVPLEELKALGDVVGDVEEDGRAGGLGVEATAGEEDGIAENFGVEPLPVHAPEEAIGGVDGGVFLLLRVDAGLAVGGRGEDELMERFEAPLVFD